jgi:hypothetical protein
LIKMIIFFNYTLMKKSLLLIFSVLLSTSLYAQIGPDGTGTVRGYYIGPGADLFNADLYNANLRGADLTGAYLADANLINANLRDANLTDADLYNARLRGANLVNADLSRAILYNANLIDALLIYADLSSADLTGAFLSGADLRNADLTGAIRPGSILSAGAIWSNAISQSDYDAVVAERDARPTQAAYDAVVAERDAKLTLDEVKDLRAGSTMIEVQNGTATLSMDIEKSSDLSSWATDRTTTVNIPIEEGSDTQFFRFKMTDASTFITVTIGEDTIAGQSTGVFYFNGVEKAVLEFQKNTNYTFIQNDSSNATYSSVHHPLMFSTGAGGELNGNGHYMTGVVYKLDGVTVSMADYVSGFVAASDRRIEWTVPSDAPSTLYYWCHFHTGQGAAMTVTD